MKGIYVTLSIALLCLPLCLMSRFIFYSVECHYAEYHYAEGRYVEGRGAKSQYLKE